MALNTVLKLRQAQSLTMTPQLLQSIRLLQYNHVELNRYIDEQIERNPLLERETGDGGSPDADGEASPVAAPSDSADTDGLAASMSETAMQDTFDASGADLYPDDAPPRETPAPRAEPGLPYGAGDGESADIENYVAARRTLREHVSEQIGMLVSDPAEALIASELADNLDERGYLDADFAALAERLGCDAGLVERVHAQLLEAEPAGLFARDLRECLAQQCRRKDRYDPAMAALIDNLELLARRDFKTLRGLCGVDESDLLDMLEEIRGLDPRPGHAFETSGSESVIHDVTVREASDGSWHIELNADALPRVLVNRQYHAELSRMPMKDAEKTFVADCMQNASWLERSLDQRAQTILKVATEIVRKQDAFLVDGITALRPMTMKMVADEIGMHESTVSRVASNKYMLTPRGLFELRYFFTVCVGGQFGSDDGHSSTAIRERIRVLIGEERPDAVLSDDAIVARLKEEGVDVARRTVAKYREGLGLASSIQRRREKKAALIAAE